MSTQKVAIVTGSNKGIGYAIVKGLCEKYSGIVYLTARDVSRGQSAVAKLEAMGLKPHFHQLDVTDEKSIDKFKEYIRSTYGGFDILINNAGIAYNKDATEPLGQQAEETVRVNYFGLLNVCNSLFPLLRQDGRVINLSSTLGLLKQIPSADLRAKFSSSQLTIDGLSGLMNRYVDDVKNGTDEQNGWNSWAYVVSKVGVSALSILQQRNFDNERPYRNISVNAVHPGYVDTDLTDHKGVLTVEQGASAPLFLALEADGLKGKFVWFDSKVVPWDQE